MGRCIYGGIYEEGSSLSDEDGDRKDVLNAIRDLGVTQLRWPGGNFVSAYHWQDGIGPKDSRPARFNLAWAQSESNRFGTDEFITTCRKLGTEPYLCVNMGTGTVDEAAGWVEYCNQEGGTYLSDLRKKNGQGQPYGVKLWALGNEIFGDWQIGRKSLDQYQKDALEFTKVMKAVDPTIVLVACGSGDPAWDRPMLEAVVNQVDYISEHWYTEVDELRDYYEILGSVYGMEELIRSSASLAEAICEKARRSRPITVALDEWNIVYNLADGHKRGTIHKDEFSYNLRDALWVASALNALQRNCQRVRIANLAQLVNVLAPIFTTPSGILERTIFYPFKLYASRSGNIALNVNLNCPVFETKRFGPQPYLDVSATYHEEQRRISVSVVNRHRDTDVIGTIELKGMDLSGDRGFLVTGADPDVQNTFEKPDSVRIQEFNFKTSPASVEYRFPKHSVSWLVFQLKS
jgi:alpha-N-arabinofuranosidase